MNLQQILKKIDTVLFDFDGVIADSEYYYYLSYNKAFEKRGHSLKKDEYWIYFTCLGIGVKSEVERYNLNFDLQTQNEIYEERKKNYSDFCAKGQIPFFEYSKDILEIFLKNDYKLAVASNSYEKDLKNILKSNDYQKPEFPVIGRKKGLRAKPESDIFAYTCGYLKSEPERCLVIEDAQKGITAAKNLGMYSVALKNKYNENINFDDCDVVLNSHEELLTILKNFFT
jgi:phosphoglycolate phosphatase-like HAD superfamily hydrolase